MRTYIHVRIYIHIYTYFRRGHLEDLATSAVGPIDLGGPDVPYHTGWHYLNLVLKV
jgi:hypothetical protein